MNEESAKAKRLAELRAAMTANFAELRGLVGPNRSHMLFSAEQVTVRECSRAYNEETKEAE